MAHQSTPQGSPGGGGQNPPEGYGPPPNLGSGQVGPPPHLGDRGPIPDQTSQALPLRPRPPMDATASNRLVSELPQTKGFLGALLDVKFDHMVTPTVVKVFSLLSLLLISAQCILLLALGLWISSWQNFWAWGWIMVIASPFVWLFEALLVRILMESVVVRFKTAEYLRIIKDKL